MSDLKVFSLELLNIYRKSDKTPGATLTSLLVILLILAKTTLLLYLLPISLGADLSVEVIYIVAVVQFIVGLRVGLLPIEPSQAPIVSTSLIFWRKASTYMIPAIILSIPIYLAIGIGAGGNTFLVFKALILNGLLFFFAGVAWSIILRAMSRGVLVRSIMLLFSIIAFFSLIKVDSFVFTSIDLAGQQGVNALLVSIVAQLSVVIVAILLIELALGRMKLVTTKAHNYSRFLTGGHASGWGQGSTVFSLHLRAIIRDVIVQRRLAGLILAMFITLVALAGIANSLGTDMAAYLSLAVFTMYAGTSAMVLAKRLRYMFNNVLSRGYLPIDVKRSQVANWGVGLSAQILLAGMFWGVMDIWLVASWQMVLALIIAAASQYILAYGWVGKLEESTHRTLAEISVFGLVLIVGYLPIGLTGLTTFYQVILVQLLWLALIAILLQITKTRSQHIRYA